MMDWSDWLIPIIAVTAAVLVAGLALWIKWGPE